MSEETVMIGGNGWNEWKNHVLESLRRNEVSHIETTKKLEHIQATLNRMQGEDKIKTWFFNLGVPALVALLVTGLTLYLK